MSWITSRAHTRATFSTYRTHSSADLQSVLAPVCSVPKCYRDAIARASMAVFGDSTPNAALSQLPFTADDNEDWEAQQDLWPVVGLGTDVAEHFQAVAGTVASQPTPPLPTAVTDTSVAGLISVAVHLDDPQLNFPYRPRRITGKQSVALDIGLFLGRLQRRPEADCNYPANHYQRKLGWHAYQRVLALTTGKPIRAVLRETRLRWQEASIASKNAWAFIAVLHSQLYTRAPGRALVRVPLPTGVCVSTHTRMSGTVEDPVVAEGFGVLLTYHTNLGLHDAGTRHLVSMQLSPDKLVSALQQKQLYSDAFLEFQNRVQVVAAELGLPSHAASMEYCFHSVDTGRVHFHAFLGPAVSFWGWQLEQKRIIFLRSQLVYGGLTPHVQVMRPRGRHGVTLSACHGMYYVLCPKQGQLFASGTAQPHEDLYSLGALHTFSSWFSFLYFHAFKFNRCASWSGLAQSAMFGLGGVWFRDICLGGDGHSQGAAWFGKLVLVLFHRCA